MPDGSLPPAVSLVTIGVVHRRRLRDVYRSAGWPCQDAVEIELVAAGLLVRERGPFGHETLRVSDAGIAVLAETLAKNRSRRDAHELLVERVAREMTRAGRLAWRGLAVRARVGEQWQIAMPDVFSVRHTTVEAYLEPIVHEVKVQRSDLLADLRRATKREAYLQLGGECWYVVKAGIAEPDEIPLECGVLVADAGGLDGGPPGAAAAGADDLSALDGAGPGDAGRRLAARGCAGRARRRRDARLTMPPSAVAASAEPSEAASPARTAGRVGRSGWRCC